MVSKKAVKPVSKKKPAGKTAVKPSAKPVRRAAVAKPAKPSAKTAIKKPARTPAKPTKPAVAPKKKAPAKPARPVVKKPVKKGVKKAVVKAPARPVKKAKPVLKKITKTPVKVKKPGKVAVKATPPAKKKLGPKSASSKPSKSLAPAAKGKAKTGRVGTAMPKSKMKAEEKAGSRRGTRVAPATVAPHVVEAPPQPPKKARFKADELRKLRTALENERERLVRDIRALDDQALTDGLAETISQQPGFSLQLADSASDNQQVDTALGIRSIELDQLVQIDEALRAIEEGDYGICHRCGETISLERLLVKPMAKYCVPCRQLLEQGKA